MNGQKVKRGRIIFFLLLVSTAWGFVSLAQGGKKKQPQNAYGVTLPEGATRMQSLGGSVSFRIDEQILSAEEYFRGQLGSLKGVEIVTRKIGDVRMVIFRDGGKNPWSSAQLTGALVKPYCFVVVNRDNPSEIDTRP